MERDLAPRALIVSIRNWFGAARLAEPLRKAGFELGSLSFPGAMVQNSSFVQRHFVLPQRVSDDELVQAALAALREFRPTVIIPGDDPAVEFLHVIAAELRSEPDSELARSLRQSLGDPRFYDSVQSRHRMQAIAQDLGVRAPEGRVVLTVEDVQEFAERYAYPVVVKAEGSCAGWGVSICKDVADVRKAIDTLQSWYPAARVPGNLTVQRFIRGKTAMRTTTAWQGRVLAGLSAIKVEVNPAPTGPSCVVEFIEHPELESTVQSLVQALGLSGFSSADFIIEDQTNAAYLVEFNPRPVPICHLGGNFGPDLCAALLSAVKGEPVSTSRSPLPEQRFVALFPQEWVRNPQSPYLRSAFHDVPWNDPLLMQSLMTYSADYLRRDEVRREEGRRESFRKRAYGEAKTPDV